MEKMQREFSRLEDNGSPFGVLEFLHWNHSWNYYKYSGVKDLAKAARLMQEAGMSFVRVDFLWEDIQPQQGRFDFAKYDQIVEVMSDYGISILGLLNYSALWASENNRWNQPPRDYKDFVNYAAAVIARYKGRIRHWEVWNEPDSPTYWEPQDGLKSYCRLLKEVYQAAKRIDPECIILNGGLANGISSVNLLYDNGSKDYFDILNVHYFAHSATPGAIKRVLAFPKLVRKVMDRNGDAQKKIWLSEIGCPGVKRGIKTAGWWLGDNPDEGEQAEWLREVYTELIKEKIVEKIFWAFLRDCKEHWSNGVDYFGVLRWDFSPKPAYRAYKECYQNWLKDQAENRFPAHGKTGAKISR